MTTRRGLFGWLAGGLAIATTALPQLRRAVPIDWGADDATGVVVAEGEGMVLTLYGDGRRFTMREIARIYGVPLRMIEPLYAGD